MKMGKTSMFYRNSILNVQLPPVLVFSVCDLMVTLLHVNAFWLLELSENHYTFVYACREKGSLLKDASFDQCFYCALSQLGTGKGVNTVHRSLPAQKLELGKLTWEFSQTAAPTHFCTGLMQLQLGWKHQHPYHTLSLPGFINQGMWAIVSSTRLFSLEVSYISTCLAKSLKKKKTTQARNLKNFTNLISFLTFSCLFISVVEVTHRARTTV